MCGIFGIFGADGNNAALYSYLALIGLQHRGQEGAGITTIEGKGGEFRAHTRKGQGLVQEVFQNEDSLHGLEGRIAVAANRYSTVKSFGESSVQPLAFSMFGKPLVTAHNGNIPNYWPLRRELEKKGALFQTDLDSEIFAHMIANANVGGNELHERAAGSFAGIVGAYSVVIATPSRMLGIRDPWGFRPLLLGKKDCAYMLASETIVFDLIEADFVKEVAPGEIVEITEEGVKSHSLMDSHPQGTKKASCIFEAIYFARPDSLLEGKSMNHYRKQMGARLHEESPADADIVMSVPASGDGAALGFSQASGITYDQGFIRNHYVGRTFIKPSKHLREFSVRVKTNPVRDAVEGKRIVVVDDSIVRGTTLKKMSGMLRNAGAREIHVRISSPPIMGPCFYGMDFPTKEELFIHSLGVRDAAAETAKLESFLGVDSLRYLSLEGLYSCVPGGKDPASRAYCDACFTGKYPTRTAF